MKTKNIIPILTAVLSFGLAQATLITISNPWNFDGTTNWTVTGSDDIVVTPTNDISR